MAIATQELQSNQVDQGKDRVQDPRINKLEAILGGGEQAKVRVDFYKNQVDKLKNTGKGPSRDSAPNQRNDLRRIKIIQSP